MNKLSDGTLIDLFISGNGQCFDILARRHKKKIFESILMVVKDRCQAEDIVQETYIKIIRSVREGRYKHEDKFGPWAIRVARNLCMDFLRTQKHNFIKKEIEFRDELFNDRLFEESHELKVIDRQKTLYLVNLLSYLPQEQREVIFFRHFRDLSFKEIATITNCSINTAVGRMRYGILKLRKLTAHQQVA